MLEQGEVNLAYWQLPEGFPNGYEFQTQEDLDILNGVLIMGLEENDRIHLLNIFYLCSEIQKAFVEDTAKISFLARALMDQLNLVSENRVSAFWSCLPHMVGSTAVCLDGLPEKDGFMQKLAFVRERAAELIDIQETPVGPENAVIAIVRAVNNVVPPPEASPSEPVIPPDAPLRRGFWARVLGLLN